MNVLPEIWKFGPAGEEYKFVFEVNAECALSQTARLSLNLARKPRDVLALLLTQRGHVVAAQELANPGGILKAAINEVDSARHSIEKIRKRLDPEHRDDPIETIRGAGYRFRWHAMRVH